MNHGCSFPWSRDAEGQRRCHVTRELDTVRDLVSFTIIDLFNTCKLKIKKAQTCYFHTVRISGRGLISPFQASISFSDVLSKLCLRLVGAICIVHNSYPTETHDVRKETSKCYFKYDRGELRSTNKSSA